MPAVGISRCTVWDPKGATISYSQVSNPTQAKDSDDDDDVTVTVDRDRFMDEFFEQVGAGGRGVDSSHP